ncbi:MAG: DUF4347 domain-containing protein, partial [Desulfatiglans sp.]|nr:DUF4347 domain-containing protein [Desulfatiglans sp.]
MSHLKKLVRRLKSFTEKNSAKKGAERRRMLFETLEKRLLLSADPVSASQQLPEDKLFISYVVPAAEVEQLSNEAANNVSNPDDVKADIKIPEAVTSPEWSGENGQNLESILSGEEASVIKSGSEEYTFTKENISVQLSCLLSEDGGHQLVIIDPSVPEYESLINKIIEDNPGGAEGQWITGQKGLIEDSDTQNEIKGNDATGPTYEVVILDPDRNGIEQITEILGQYQDIDTVHVISHGASGMMRIGNSIVDRGSLEEHSENLKAWQQGLADGGDILLYGCNIADGELGIGFITELSRQTGADVAASANATGTPERAGDWILEYNKGSIESAFLFQNRNMSNYSHLLADISVNGTLGADTIIVDFGSLTITGGAASHSLNTSDNYLINGLGGNDTLIIQGTTGADTININSSGITINGLTYGILLNSMSSIERLVITGGDGNDSITLSGDILLAGTAFTILSESITVNSTVNTGTGSINLYAAAEDNSIFGDARAHVILENATLIAGDINIIAEAGVTAEASLELNFPVDVALINV